MGEEAAGSDKSVTESLAEVLPPPDIADELAARHGINPSPALDVLVEYLVNLSCRDQESAEWEAAGATNPIDMNDWSARRSAAYALAKEMKQAAERILARLHQLHKDFGNFHNLVQSSPALLEAVFDIDLAGC